MSNLCPQWTVDRHYQPWALQVNAPGFCHFMAPCRCSSSNESLSTHLCSSKIWENCWTKKWDQETLETTIGQRSDDILMNFCWFLCVWSCFILVYWSFPFLQHDFPTLRLGSVRSLLGPREPCKAISQDCLATSSQLVPDFFVPPIVYCSRASIPDASSTSFVWMTWHFSRFKWT